MKRFTISFNYTDESGKQVAVSQKVSMNDSLDQWGNEKYNDNLAGEFMEHGWIITIFGDMDGNDCITHECHLLYDKWGGKTLKPSHVITYKGDRIVSEDKFSVAVRK